MHSDTVAAVTIIPSFATFTSTMLGPCLVLPGGWVAVCARVEEIFGMHHANEDGACLIHGAHDATENIAASIGRHFFARRKTDIL